MYDADDKRELSADTIRLVGWALAAERELETGAPIEVTDLTAYLCGALEPAAARKLEASLTSTRFGRLGRASLIQTRRTLSELTALPWDEVRRTAAGSDDRGRIAACWLELAGDALKTAPTAWQQCLTDGVESLRQTSHEARVGAAVVWDGLVRAMSALRAGMEQPGALALVRGEGPELRTGLVAVGEVTSDGAIHARLPKSLTAGAAARILTLVTPIGVWPLKRLNPDEEWCIVPHAGRDLDLPVGPLPSGALELVDPDTLQPSWSGPILAEVTSNRNIVPVTLTLHGEPRFADGKLSLALGLPESVRREHADANISVGLLVAPGWRQQLGSWPVAEWGAAPRLLEAPAPGVPPLPICLRIEITSGSPPD